MAVSLIFVNEPLGSLSLSDELLWEERKRMRFVLNLHHRGKEIFLTIDHQINLIFTF